MSTDNRPRLSELDANTRDAPSGYNLDVSGTVGPDYLGQETTNVDGHPNDRPGVRSRLPESSGDDDPRIRRMDTGEELPVLLESDMRADPCEGTQGTYTAIVEGECPRCGYDRLKRSVHTLAGEHQESCMACDAIVEPSAEHGYRMPKTQKDRAKMRKNAGPKLGELTTRSVIDLEPDTGFGPRVALVTNRGSTSFYKDDVESLFWILVDNDDVDLRESIVSNMRMPERYMLGASLLPDDITIESNDDGDDE